MAGEDIADYILEHDAFDSNGYYDTLYEKSCDEKKDDLEESDRYKTVNDWFFTPFKNPGKTGACRGKGAEEKQDVDYLRLYGILVGKIRQIDWPF